MPSNVSHQPLSNIKVLDFTTLLPGPMAGLLLAEAGASVLKIERPGEGDELRRYEPKWGKDSAAFALLNRGKKSLALDLKDPQQLAIIEPLIRQADVLLEQFRPGVMDRLGLGYSAVRQINPGIIYCSITGYGQNGPLAGIAGHDLNYIGDSGLLSLSTGPSDRPVVPPVLAADLAGGSYPAVVNILLALLARQRTGEGCHLDIAMTENMFMLMTWAMAQGLTSEEWPEDGNELLTGGSPRYQIYVTGDGAHLAAAPLEQRFWDTFCELIELPEEFRNDGVDPQRSIAAVREIIASRNAEDWKKVFYGQDCCCSIVKSVYDALREPHFHMRGLFDHVLENEDGEELPAAPVCISPQFRSAPDKVKSAPALGAHNDAIIKTGS